MGSRAPRTARARLRKRKLSSGSAAKVRLEVLCAVGGAAATNVAQAS